jgi:alpha-beta hydrolase superfamily lysophospholipase
MRPSRRFVRFAVAAAAATVVAVLAAAALIQRSTPELSPWHTVRLASELEAGDIDPDFGWPDYLALEERLFRELDERVVGPSTDANPWWNRYAPGGANNPAGFPTNWNRSFELAPPAPVGGALLIHGLTDSPYSMRRTAEVLHGCGLHVIGLRLPGHGTTPGALRAAEVEDWRAAVRLAYRHLTSTVAGRGPILVGGYSNGAALALDLAIEALDDPDLPIPDRIVLYSPAIGITRAAVLARASRLLRWMPWYSRLGWSGVEPEFDPFKYSSFPTDAGYLTHVLTRSVRQRLESIEGRQDAEAFPPVLTLMSLADATVLVEAVVSGLHDRLVDNDSELVIFDVNRRAAMHGFFASDPARRLSSLTARASTPFTLTVITNVDETTPNLEEWRRAAGALEATVTPLELEWPRGFYSLSHVAVPFPPDDPIYGTEPGPGPGYGIQIGALEPRGERGLLSVSAAQLTRLRSNPFFSYVERRLVELAAGG